MDTDRPLKLLFQACAVDLLPLTGDAGSIVRHVGPVEILLALAGQYYTVSELARIVGRDRMSQSSLYTEGLAEGASKDVSKASASCASPWLRSTIPPCSIARGPSAKPVRIPTA